MPSPDRASGPESSRGSGRPSNRLGHVTQHTFALPGLSVERVFELFSDPRRLNELTPSWFSLIVRSPMSSPLRVGTRIAYSMKWRGLPMTWRSVITEIEPPHWLVYEQLEGPFRGFRHEHSFVSIEGNVLVTDRISYGVFGGSVAARVLVSPDLRRILSYREQAAARILLSHQLTDPCAST